MIKYSPNPTICRFLGSTNYGSSTIAESLSLFINVENGFSKPDIIR
jgi:hypothetical protein